MVFYCDSPSRLIQMVIGVDAFNTHWIHRVRLSVSTFHTNIHIEFHSVPWMCSKEAMIHRRGVTVTHLWCHKDTLAKTGVTELQRQFGKDMVFQRQSQIRNLASGTIKCLNRKNFTAPLAAQMDWTHVNVFVFFIFIFISFHLFLSLSMHTIGTLICLIIGYCPRSPLIYVY